MIQGYLKEIEELRAKLLESEAMCQQLRKTSSWSPSRGSLSRHVAMTGEFETRFIRKLIISTGIYLLLTVVLLMAHGDVGLASTYKFECFLFIMYNHSSTSER